MNPADRATALEGSSEIQAIHQKYAAQGQSNLAQQQSDVKTHFVTFVKNSQNQLVELNGQLDQAHLCANECPDLLKGAAAEVKKRCE